MNTTIDLDPIEIEALKRCLSSPNNRYCVQLQRILAKIEQVEQCRKRKRSGKNHYSTK